MDINELTLGQIKEIVAMFGNNQISAPSTQSTPAIDQFGIGQKVIIRTDRAGVWFGTLSQKSGHEVILSDARRMWRWWAAESISLSAVALHGIKQEKSKVAEALPKIWLEAIEIIPCSNTAIVSIEGAPIVEAE